MAKERLSKLQKWILEQSYKINIEHDGSVVGNMKSNYYRNKINGYKLEDETLAYQYFECWIYEKYYGFNPRKYGSTLERPSYKKAHVVVYRAVQNMEKKGLIYLKNYLSYRMRNWHISEKGIEVLRKINKENKIEAENQNEEYQECQN